MAEKAEEGVGFGSGPYASMLEYVPKPPEPNMSPNKLELLLLASLFVPVAL